MTAQGSISKPQMVEYQDTGCDLFHSCLSCPRRRCKYDDPAEAQRERGMMQDRQKVRLMEREGWTVQEAAEHFGVTARTVHRILARDRRGWR